MGTIEIDSGAHLAAKLNIGEVVSWKLHWLTMKLQGLQKAMRETDFGTCADLKTGAFADFLQDAQSLTYEFAQLQNEVKIMLGLDYSSEVEPLFQYVDRYDTYIEEVGNVKAFLERKARQILEAETNRVLESIATIRQGLF